MAVEVDRVERHARHAVHESGVRGRSHVAKQQRLQAIIGNRRQDRQPALVAQIRTVGPVANQLRCQSGRYSRAEMEGGYRVVDRGIELERLVELREVLFSGLLNTSFTTSPPVVAAVGAMSAPCVSCFAQENTAVKVRPWEMRLVAFTCSESYQVSPSGDTGT